MTDVKIGQIWRDKSKYTVREVEVVRVSKDQPLGPHSYITVRNTKTGRQTSVQSWNFLKGYTLIKESQ